MNDIDLSLFIPASTLAVVASIEAEKQKILASVEPIEGEINKLHEMLEPFAKNLKDLEGIALPSTVFAEATAHNRIIAMRGHV